MQIQSGDLLIRDAAAADAEQLAAWWNDGAVMAHAGFPLGLGTRAEKVRGQLARGSDERGRVLILELAGRPIGEMSWSRAEERTAEIGIKICERDCQEKGLGRVALSLLIRELFARGYGRIALDTNRENRRARHVYELLGFRKLRVNTNAWQDQLGAWQSSVDYELRPGDFRDCSAAGLAAGRSGLCVQRLGAERVAELIAFNRLCFPTDFWKEEDWRELLSDQRAIYWALLDGEKLIGDVFLYNWQGEKDYVKIMNLSVHPDYRGRGLAHRLLDYAREELSRRGMGKYCGETRASNAAMQRVFADCGYRLNRIEEDYFENPPESAYKYVLEL